MKVAKWGNSLAVRLPRPVVETLGLKEGDEVQISAVEPRALKVARDQSREEALARMRSARWHLPPDYKFDREEANERGGFVSEPDESGGS